MSQGIGGHQSPQSRTNDWITPREILTALGPFDLDPCACDPQPWPTATTMLTEDGLCTPWRGRLNFYYPNGQRSNYNAGAPSVLIAYGDRNAESLRHCGLTGAFQRLQNGVEA